MPKSRRALGKKISWDEEDIASFEEIKRRLCGELTMQRLNPAKSFVLRVVASQYAVGASLDQLLDDGRVPTFEDVRARKAVPVAFMSSKLTGSQLNWVPENKKHMQSFWHCTNGNRV